MNSLNPGIKSQFLVKTDLKITVRKMIQSC